MKYKIEVKDIRVGEGLTQAAFAEKYHIPVRTLQEWEQGRSKPPAYVEAMIKQMTNTDTVYPSIDELFAGYDGEYKPEEMAAVGTVGKEMI